MKIIICKRKVLRLILILLFLTLAAIFLASRAQYSLYPLKYNEIVTREAQANQIDKYLIFSIMKAESNFDHTAQSHKEAKGLMQVTDETALWCAEKMGLEDFDIGKIHQPEYNIKIGTWYISYLMEVYDESMIDALAAYNAGIGNVNSWMRESGASRIEIDQIPFEETRQYVQKVLRYYEKYKKLYG